MHLQNVKSFWKECKQTPVKILFILWKLSVFISNFVLGEIFSFKIIIYADYALKTNYGYLLSYFLAVFIFVKSTDIFEVAERKKKKT